MTINTQKQVYIEKGPTGPTGTWKGVNILGAFTGPTGLFAQWKQYTGPTGASGPNGNYEHVYNIGPTGIKGEHKTVIIPGYSAGGGGGSAIVIGARLGATPLLSTDGANWSVPAGPSWMGNGNNYVAYAPALTKFCVVQEFAGSTAVTSDGITWTQGAITGDQYLDICWSPALGLFVAVSATGKVQHSPDGLVWTAAATVPQANNWHSVCWADTLGLFVAATDGGTNQLMTSPDGNTWTVQTNAITGAQGIVWDEINHKLVTYSSSGNSSTSTDAINWTAHVAAPLAVGGLHHGTYLRGTGGFVIGGNNGSIITSPDGITWTVHSWPSAATPQVTAVGYSAALGLYFAGGNDGTSGHDISTSLDGSTWTIDTGAPHAGGMGGFAASA
jgi:hypothetical protein